MADDPQSFAAFAYARNNPMVGIDPDGLRCYLADTGTVRNRQESSSESAAYECTVSAPCSFDDSQQCECYCSCAVLTNIMVQFKVMEWRDDGECPACNITGQTEGIPEFQIDKSLLTNACICRDAAYAGR